MFEKVNPSHPDKVADRIAGAIVDLAYKKNKNPKVACEVLIGHNKCTIVNETDTHLKENEINLIVNRIAKIKNVDYREFKQDEHLSKNQSKKFRCGDNGIFKGSYVTDEQYRLTKLAKFLYRKFKSDGKYIFNRQKNQLIICQSKATTEEIKDSIEASETMIINPLGYWTGGLNVDTGATNRKLGSDMGDAVTGGGLHGKDLSKADVSLNIYCFLKAQEYHEDFKLCCAIGDEYVDGKPYKDIVEIARLFITLVGGFEKFAEWGLIR